VNPLREVPLLGLPLRLLDDFLREAPFPTWLTQFLEFVVLVFLTYWLIKAILTYALPWLSGRTEAAVRLVELICLALLLPEELVTREMRRRRKNPSAVLFGYSNAILAAGSGVESAIRWLFPRLAAAKAWPTSIPVLIVATLFLLWNSLYCGGTEGCLSPFAQWKAHWSE
jgi:hypothetical protein